MQLMTSTELQDKVHAARQTLRTLAASRTSTRDNALRAMAEGLRREQTRILEANKLDVEAATRAGSTAALIDRLTLNPSRLDGMRASLLEVAALPDPLGEGEVWTRPNGLQIMRARVPLGVIGIIYEARPNVTIEAASLAFKAGNAVLLRGSSSALRTNQILVEVMTEALRHNGLPPAAIALIENTDREIIDEMVRMNGLIDVVIPRGGHELIRRVVQTATVPVIETGEGNCHVFVDEAADLDKAERIVVNAKVHRPSACNAAESLLVHRAVASTFLPRVGAELTRQGVELRACPDSLPHLPTAKAASDDDHGREFLDMIMSVKIVDSVDEAVDWINRHGTRHSEAIVTEDYTRARLFAQGVDAAAVYVNASTRFTDGGEFGYGGEMGISTQKLHARGPMGLRELTTSKFVVMGDGQIRE
jgi:glutamate-5-semialdehyde dehydrogenase